MILFHFTTFREFNIHKSMPEYMAKIPAVLIGGLVCLLLHKSTIQVLPG